MGKVSITVNGRAFAVGCEDGEEEAVAALGRQFDAHVSALAGQVGQIGDVRLFLMAALVLADHLRESERTIETLKSQIAQLQSHGGGKADKRAQAIEEAMQALRSASERIETLAGRIEGASTH